MTDKLRNNSLYDTFSNEEKQIYWNDAISRIYRGSYERFPIEISEFINNMGVKENDFESFIPKIIETSIDWSGDELSIEDLFILDDIAQRKLGLWENTNVKKNANSILNGEKDIAEQIFDNTKKLIKEYPSYSEEKKEEYWNSVFYKQDRYYSDYGKNKIKISSFRSNYAGEKDIEKYALLFVNWYNKWFGMSDDEYSIEDLFILDETAKKKIGLWEDTNVKKNANSILNGEIEISGVEISTLELIESIGDLYYDTLADFLLEISKYIQDTIITTKLIETSTHIKEAWRWCEKYGKNHPKHSDVINGTSLSNNELAQEIGGLDKSKLEYFIKLLGNKIEKDGNNDKERGKEKLGKALLNASNTLKD